MSLEDLLLIALQASLELVVLSVGLRVRWRELRALLGAPSGVARMVASFFVVPALAVACGVLGTDGRALSGFVFLALVLTPVPATLSSGSYAEAAVPRLAPVVAIAVVAMPAALLVHLACYGTPPWLEPNTVVRLVIVDIALPFAVGVVVRARWETFARAAARPLSDLSAALLVFALVPLTLEQWELVRTLARDGDALVVGALLAGTLAAAYRLVGGGDAVRAPLARAVVVRHPGLALLLASGGYSGSARASAAVLLYMIASATLVFAVAAVRAPRRAITPQRR